MPIVARIFRAAALLGAFVALAACFPDASGPPGSSPPNPGEPPVIGLPPDPGRPPNTGRAPNTGSPPWPGGDDPVNSQPAPGPGGTVPAGNWRLDRMDGTQAGIAAAMRILPGGEIRGQGPCNGFTARAIGRPPALRIVDLNATERSCPALATEMRFFAALAAVDRMMLRDDRLVLTSSSGHRLVFRR